MSNARASNELVLILDVNSKEASQVVRRFAGEIDKVNKEAAGAAGNLNRIADSGKKAQTNWVQFAAKWGTVTAGFWAAQRAISGVMDALESGGRAIALENRIEGITGGAEKMDAAMRGLQQTLNQTDTQGFVIQMDQIGLSAKQIEIATGYALAFSETMGKELAPTLERVVQAFASGRATSFRALGIDAKDAADAMDKMAVAAKAMAENMDGTSVAVKQARAGWDDFVSFVEVGSTTIVGKLWQVEKGFFSLKGEIEQVKREHIKFNDEQIRFGEIWGRLHHDQVLSFWNSLSADIESAADAAIKATADFAGFGVVLAMFRRRGRPAQEGDADFVGPTMPSDIASQRKAMQAEADLWKTTAAEIEQVRASVQEALSRSGGRGGGRGRSVAVASSPLNPDAFAAIHSNTGDGMNPIVMPEAQDRDASLRNLAMDRRVTFEDMASAMSDFTDANAQMWQALGDATGSKKAAKVMAAFSATQMAILAVESGVKSAKEFAEGLAAAATPGMQWSAALHFASSAAFAAVAVGKAVQAGSMLSNIGSSGGGSGRSASSFSSGTDFGNNYSSGQQGNTYIYYVQTGGGDIVADERSAQSWVMAKIAGAGARGEAIDPSALRRSARSNAFGGGM